MPHQPIDLFMLIIVQHFQLTCKAKKTIQQQQQKNTQISIKIYVIESRKWDELTFTQNKRQKKTDILIQWHRTSLHLQQTTATLIRCIIIIMIIMFKKKRLTERKKRATRWIV